MKAVWILNIILCVAFWVHTAHAQDYEFKVVASHGQVQKANGQQRLWAGSQLYGGDQIVVGSGGYIGLVHKSGKTLELKAPGTYAVSQLAANIGGKSSTTSKYVNYVVGEMAKAEKEDINTNHRRYMAITGSVQRALLGKAGALLPEEVLLFDAKLHLELFSTDPQKQYEAYRVDVKTLFDAENESNALKSFVVKGNSGVVDLSFLRSADLRKSLGLYEDDPFVLVIYPIELQKTEVAAVIGASTYSVQLLDEQDPMYQEIASVVGQDDDKTAIDYLLEAAFFEEKGLFADALRCYNQAIELAPEIDAYKGAKMEFLARYQEEIMRNKPKK